MTGDYYRAVDGVLYCRGCDRECGSGHNDGCPVADRTGEATALPGKPVEWPDLEMGS